MLYLGLRIKKKTYQIFADHDGILEHGPNYSLVAGRGCQGSEVAIILCAIHPKQKIVQRNSSSHRNRSI